MPRIIVCRCINVTHRYKSCAADSGSWFAYLNTEISIDSVIHGFHEEKRATRRKEIEEIERLDFTLEGKHCAVEHISSRIQVDGILTE